VGKLVVIVSYTPFYSELSGLSLNIARTALKKGHKVTLFLFMDGVYNALNTQRGDLFKVESVNKILGELSDLKAKIIVCKLCSELRGVNESLIVSVAEATGVAELNDELLDADSVLSFIGGV